MKPIQWIVASTVMACAGHAMAEGASCNAAATEKKLAGAAKTSFCRRQFKIDHLCQLNFDQGSKAGCLAPGCG